MAARFPSHSIHPTLSPHHPCVLVPPHRRPRVRKDRNSRCAGDNLTTDNSPTNRGEPKSPATEDALLKVAWYGSELLGIAASIFRSPSIAGAPQRERDLEVPTDGLGALSRALVAENIKGDFERSYFVTGNLTLDAYEDDCEFADPAGSFRGLHRFKRNCTNFGNLLEKSNMRLMKWEDLEDKSIGHWRFSCVMSFPWRPILSATGYTEYFFDAKSGKVCRHMEHWNVPKMALLKQIVRPSRWSWAK